jgi:hypothetical protein
MTTHEKRKLQDRFLAVCRDSCKELKDVLDDLGITHEQLDEWLEEARFRRRVLALRKALSRRRELELERGATASAGRLTRFAIGAERTFPERERRACLDIVKFWNATSDRKKYPKYPRRGERKRRSLAHPNAGDAKALLRRMEK